HLLGCVREPSHWSKRCTRDEQSKRNRDSDAPERDHEQEDLDPAQRVHNAPEVLRDLQRVRVPETVLHGHREDAKGGACTFRVTDEGGMALPPRDVEGTVPER